MERMKMANQDKLERMKNDVISNMDKEKLKKYLYYLTRKYYETYMKGDEKEFNETIEKIMDVISEFRETYVNLMGFIYYCFYLNSILIISEKVSHDEFSLQNISKYDLMEDDESEDELHHDIKNIFNKDRIRRRRYEKGISESFE